MLETGILWFDNSKNSLEVRVQKGVDYYENKYGRLPTLVLVHPSLMEKGVLEVEIGKVKVCTYHATLPGHFWIGVEKEEKVSV